MTKKSLTQLLNERKVGHSLEQQLYLEPDVFQEDMKRVFSQHWVLVDHISRIPKAGDYFVVNVAGEEIIVVRENDTKINAFYNVCRHRGSKICLEQSGSRKLLVCPYHNWSYKLDGSLNAARLMASDFKLSEHSLHPCHIQVDSGIIYLCTAGEEAPAFDVGTDKLQPYLEFHGIESAKIATRKLYRVHANWKLVIENFSECYHCNACHPELCSVHRQSRIVGFGGGPGSGSPEDEQQFMSELATWEKSTIEIGHPVGVRGNEEHQLGFPIVSRFPFLDGFQTESQDGKPVSKIMGECKQYDGGVTAFGWNVWSWAFASNDYAVLFRFTPVNENQTDCESIWLVHPDTEQDIDYDLDRLMWFWDSTLEEDTTIIENNNAGIKSSHYVPGPYSIAESAVEKFDKWYVDSMFNSLNAD